MRGKIISALTVMAVVLMLPVTTIQAADEVTITAVPVTEQIYMMTGKGGNLGLFIGEDGTFLIDDQFAPLTPKHLAAIRAAGGETPK